MINELQIYGFKMFAEATFKMAPLTILGRYEWYWKNLRRSCFTSDT